MSMFGKDSKYSKEKQKQQGLLAGQQDSGGFRQPSQRATFGESKQQQQQQPNRPVAAVEMRKAVPNKEEQEKPAGEQEEEKEGEVIWPEDSMVYWDVVVAFKVYEEGEEPPTKTEGFKTKEEIVKICQKASLQTYLFYSNDKKIVFLKVGATIDRIKRAADEMDYQMLLSEDYLQNHVDVGDFPVVDEPDITLYHPYEYIYGNYEREPEFHDLYQVVEGEIHPFRSLDRIKLVLEVMESDEDWGGGLELFNLKENGSILSFYPMRDMKIARRLGREWLPYHVRPWQQPIDDIRDYFGEKIALYFEFLGHYATWLIPNAIFGIIVMADIMIETALYGSLANALGAGVLVPFYCIFVSFWSQFMLEFWKRKEATKAMEWGMSNFEDIEEDRAEYTGDLIYSYITGEQVKHFPRAKRELLMYWSSFVIGLMILVVIACTAVIFYGKYYVAEDVNDDSTAASAGEGLSLANAVQIQVLNYLYGNLAIYLTTSENHRTDTEHEDSLIAKLFMFQFVNSYTSFFYIAFIKQNIGDPCAGGCMQELCIQLSTIFMTRLIANNVIKFATFYLTQLYKKKAEAFARAKALLTGDKDFFKPKSYVEDAFYLDEYDPLLGTLEAYSDLSIEYGYVTLFVAAFPIAPFFAFISNYVLIRSSAWSLLYQTKRPIPRGCQDIGTWMSIFQVTALAAVVTNAGLICYTMSLLNDYSPWGVVWIFIGFQYTCISLMGVFAYLVDDVPEEVDIQLKRMEHLCDIAFDRAEIEDNEVESLDESIVIHDHDNEEHMEPTEEDPDMPSSTSSS